MNFPNLTLSELHTVTTVAAKSHFGRAAESLGMAQPTLSAQVQRVEAALGAKIFERAGRRFFITPAGERLLPIMREVLAHAHRLPAAARHGQDSAPSRPLQIGVIPTLGPYLMPHLLLPTRRGATTPHFGITEQTTARLIEQIRDGTLDAALLSVPLRHESLDSIPLFDEPFRVLAPRGSDVLTCSRLAPSRLCASEMILLEEGHCLREQALQLCSKRGRRSPRVVTTSIETLKYLVAAGEGYSLLPGLACELAPAVARLVELRGFDERPPVRRIGLCFRASTLRRREITLLGDFIRRALPAGVQPVTPTNSARVRIVAPG